MTAVELQRLSGLLANPPYAGGIEGQRRWLRAVMASLGVRGQPLARGAGLAPSTLNRFLAKGASHRLRPQTLDAIVEAASTIWQSRRRQHAQLDDPVLEDGSSVPLPCYHLAALNAQSCAPVYELPFDRRFLDSLPARALENLMVVLMAGDSMLPTLRDGDQVLVDRGYDRISLDGLYLLPQTGDRPPLLRRITLEAAGAMAWVATDNRVYGEPQRFPLDQLTVAGRIFWIGKRV
ncbi:MAG: hypothetical protein Kilf2KO_21130 [Rhodospirillales bacterium]